jgi:hypothetical protein
MQERTFLMNRKYMIGWAETLMPDGLVVGIGEKQPDGTVKKVGNALVTRAKRFEIEFNKNPAAYKRYEITL